MRIGVIGLGAIGGVVAARLLRSRAGGEEIALAAGSEASAARLRETGLCVEGEPRVHAPVVLASLANGAPSVVAPRFDLLLVCTRTDATESAVSSAAPLLAEGGAVVCLQNGLPEERASALVGPHRTLGAVIGWSASAEGPGRYVVTGGGKFTLGAFSAKAQPKLPFARAVLQRAFPVRTTHNLAGARWSKLAMNCALSTLGAISGLDLGGLASRRDARTLALRVVAEVVEVSRARGVRLERVAGVDPAWIAEARPSLASPLKHLVVRLAAARRPRQRSGMLVRLQAGRTSGQVDDLNGAVVEAARALGRDAPLNARLCALVHAIERGEERIGAHQLERLAAAGAQEGGAR